MLEAASDKKLGKYFISTFKEISSENPLPAKFAASCLQHSEASWEAWSGHTHSSSSSSAIILRELCGRVLTPPPVSLQKLAEVLTKVAKKLPEKDKELAKVCVLFVVCVCRCVCSVYDVCYLCVCACVVHVGVCMCAYVCVVHVCMYIVCNVCI